MSIQEKLRRYSTIILDHLESVIGNHLVISLTQEEYNELTALPIWSTIKIDDKIVEFGGNTFRFIITDKPDILSSIFNNR